MLDPLISLFNVPHEIKGPNSCNKRAYVDEVTLPNQNVRTAV